MSAAMSQQCRGTLQRGRSCSARSRRVASVVPRRNSTGSSSATAWRLFSHNQHLEADLAALECVQLRSGWPEHSASAAADSSAEFDIIGLGQAMCDAFQDGATSSDEFLESLGVEKGARKLIGVDERGTILEHLEGDRGSYRVCAGGSLSNTLMGIARLSTAAVNRVGGRELRVAMAGLIGSDALGAYYMRQMTEAGVQVISAPVAGANTGTVCVLTSPDAQRTMLSYLGSPAEVEVDAKLEAAISRSRMLVVEGYLWELPGAERTIMRAIAAAQRCGAVVAMTAGDAGVVERHHAEIWRAIDRGIDLLFTNASEAAALLRCRQIDNTMGASTVTTAAGNAGSDAGSVLSFINACSSSSSSAAQQAALALGPHCSMVVVTDGASGSYITALGQLHVVPPVWNPQPPVDTCGAGDAYAAGLLYALLQNHTVNSMGRTAARTAAVVINMHGAALTPEAALTVADTLPTAAPSTFFESLTLQPRSAD